MILIIVIAAVLLLVLIALAVCAVCHKRWLYLFCFFKQILKTLIYRAKKNSYDSNYTSPRKTNSKLDFLPSFTDYGITNAYQASIIDTRPTGTISTIKSQTRSYATEFDDINLRDMKLNLPQQYEVTIH